MSNSVKYFEVKQSSTVLARKRFMLSAYNYLSSNVPAEIKLKLKSYPQVARDISARGFAIVYSNGTITYTITVDFITR